MVRRNIERVRAISPRSLFSMFVGGIGLAASLIQLITFVGAIQTPETASNFYVNSREFISWTLLTWVYLFCLANAYWRRRQRELFGGSRTDHSITNLFSVFTIIYNRDSWGDKLELQAGRNRFRNRSTWKYGQLRLTT